MAIESEGWVYLCCLSCEGGDASSLVFLLGAEEVLVIFWVLPPAACVVWPGTARYQDHEVIVVSCESENGQGM